LKRVIEETSVTHIDIAQARSHPSKFPHTCTSECKPTLGVWLFRVNACCPNFFPKNPLAHGGPFDSSGIRGSAIAERNRDLLDPSLLANNPEMKFV
jgi:hypothetical protein